MAHHCRYLERERLGEANAQRELLANAESIERRLEQQTQALNGAYGQIQTDSSVAMRVHVVGEVPPESLPTLRWRGIAFDEFDGRAWSVSPAQRTTLRRSLASDFRVGAFRGRGPLLTQEVFLEPIGTEVIFVAPRALRLEARAPEITLDDMGAITVPSASARLHYRVESELETPPPPEVRVLVERIRVPGGRAARDEDREVAT